MKKTVSDDTEHSKKPLTSELWCEVPNHGKWFHFCIISTSPIKLAGAVSAHADMGG